MLVISVFTATQEGLWMQWVTKHQPQQTCYRRVWYYTADTDTPADWESLRIHMLLNPIGFSRRHLRTYRRYLVDRGYTVSTALP